MGSLSLTPYAEEEEQNHLNPYVKHQLSINEYTNDIVLFLGSPSLSVILCNLSDNHNSYLTYSVRLEFSVAKT